MTPEQHGQLIRKAFDEWNNGNIDFTDELYAENCSIHDPSYPVTGISEMKEQARQMRRAIPDLHMNVHEVLADGDMTAARWTMGGTQRGEFQGLPATGKTFVVDGVVMDKWEGDRIVEEWNSYDMAGLLQQLGLMPEMAQLAEEAPQRGRR